MKKTFFQLHIGNILMLTFILAILVSCVYYSIEIAIVQKNLVLGIVMLFPLLMLKDLYKSFYYHIVFFDEKIYVSGELIEKEARTQFEDTIKYSDIDDIRLVYVAKNSKGKKFEMVSIRSLRPRMFFEFLLKDGKSKLVYISFFSRMQKDKMLCIINEKTGLNLSYKQMYHELDARCDELRKRKNKKHDAENISHENKEL